MKREKEGWKKEMEREKKKFIVILEDLRNPSDRSFRLKNFRIFGFKTRTLFTAAMD